MHDLLNPGPPNPPAAASMPAWPSMNYESYDERQRTMLLDKVSCFILYIHAIVSNHVLVKAIMLLMNDDSDNNKAK